MVSASAPINPPSGFTSTNASSTRVGPLGRFPGETAGSSSVRAADRFDPSEPADASRQSLVARVRAELRAGTYDTPEKFDVAVRRAIGSIDLTA